MARFITFLTDFGLQDDFVGTCHGVIKRIAPDVEIIDITHGIAPQGVLQGALTLSNSLPFMPVGVHLAVVDPGVGGARRALALRDQEGRLHVGPDNGLLIPAVEKFGGIAEAHELANPEYALESVSRTFHGRDLFAPAAAHLALGVELSALGPPIAVDALARLDLPQPEVGTSRIKGTVLAIDRFGNVQLNLDRSHSDQVGIVPGTWPCPHASAVFDATVSTVQWTPGCVSAYGIAPYLTTSWMSGPLMIEPPWLTARK